MEPLGVATAGFGRIEKLGVFLRTGNAIFERRLLSGASIAPSFENDFVGSMLHIFVLTLPVPATSQYLHPY